MASSSILLHMFYWISEYPGALTRKDKKNGNEIEHVPLDHTSDRRVHIARQAVKRPHRDVSRTPTDRRPRKRENEAATRVTTVNTLESLDPR